MAREKSEIQDQIKLPIRVAIEVVLQGLRTRLGRSIVTISGVVLGIAFLMSILSGGLAKQGVANETSDRAEIARMVSFLKAETGPLMSRHIAMKRMGNVTEVERRFLESVMAEGAIEDNTDASAVIIVAGGIPSPQDLPTRATERRRILAMTRVGGDVMASTFTVVQLARQPRPEEVAKQARDASKAKFRSLWIIIISLLVTVIGITNAMLMSVTERFREIGTMKCLGALSSFIRRIFLIESSLMGAVGGVLGTILGSVFSIVAFGFTYGFGLVLRSIDWPMMLLYFVFSILAAVILSVIAALYPASFAASMVPATALRTNI